MGWKQPFEFYQCGGGILAVNSYFALSISPSPMAALKKKENKKVFVENEAAAIEGEKEALKKKHSMNDFYEWSLHPNSIIHFHFSTLITS